MLRSPYRKEWYVGTNIAKEFLGMDISCRIPTITEYAEAFSCSRGLVQNALSFLEDHHAVTLNKMGKRGTFLLDKNEELLFEYSGLSHLTASMPPPVNLYFAGLATGICSGMSGCRVPFTFAFVQGSENRVRALIDGAYDFVVTTKYAAERYASMNSDVEIAFPFEGSEYSLPYKLYINRPGVSSVQDGMTIALDPSSSDHAAITRKICQGKNVYIREMPLISGVHAFYTGEIDCIVFRDEIQNRGENLVNIMLRHERIVSPENISTIPIEEVSRDMQLPVALVLKSNYGMAGLLRRYLAGRGVGAVQKQVLSGLMVPQFY